MEGTLNRTKKVAGEAYNLPRFGTGDIVRIGTVKTGTVTNRKPSDPITKTGGATSVKWKGTKDVLTYSWDDFPTMQLIYLGEEGSKR